MNEPRFKVGGVTGWPIPAQNKLQSRVWGKAVPATFYYVLDRGNNHEVVGQFIGNQHNKKERAEELAAKLNAEDEAWLAERGLA